MFLLCSNMFQRTGGRDDVDELIYWMGMAAVAVSAITGVLEAGRKPIDLFGIALVALATALGGGTVRDLLLDRPVFWIEDQNYVYCALGAGVATFVLARLVRLPVNVFLLPDAVGLALFTVVGTQIAIVWNVPWLAASVLGVVTGVLGGVLRDMLCNEVPLVFSGVLYGTAAWAGALVFIGLWHSGLAPGPASYAAMALIVALRLAALRWRIGVPIFISRR
jgi:uncharacterized membrane protein YeiH